MQNHLTTSNIHLSQHFVNDRQHRGICVKDSELQTYLEFGDRQYDGRGAQICFLSKRSFHKMQQAGMSSAALQRYQKQRNVRLVLSLDGSLITGMYAQKRRQRVR